VLLSLPSYLIYIKIHKKYPFTYVIKGSPGVCNAGKMCFHIQFTLYKLLKNLTFNSSKVTYVCTEAHTHTYCYINPHATFGAVTIFSQADYIYGSSQTTDWSYNSPVSKGKPTTQSKTFGCFMQLACTYA
jgi:hypothetical protein